MAFGLTDFGWSTRQCASRALCAATVVVAYAAIAKLGAATAMAVVHLWTMALHAMPERTTLWVVASAHELRHVMTARGAELGRVCIDDAATIGGAVGAV